MRYIFGPVASRRFGRSLGIDLSPQRKQCNFNCVYCELGAGKPVSAMSEPCEIGPVIAELKTALQNHAGIDVITITANGEPTLHPRFAKLVSALKALHLPQKLLVLSNGSLVRENSAALMKLDICKFSLDSVLAKSFRKVDGPHAGIDVITITANGEPTLHPRFAELVDALKALHLPQKLLVLSNGSLVRENSAALAKLDICKFSLDSALTKSFRKVDGPHAGISAEDIISAIADFAHEFRGELDIEILVVRGLNDTQEDFTALNAALARINPHRVDIGTIDRPPAYRVQGVSEAQLRYLATFIENQNVNIIAAPKYASERLSFSEDEILRTLSRRPQRTSDVEAMFDEASAQILRRLVGAGKVVFKDGYYKIAKK